MSVLEKKIHKSVPYSRFFLIWIGLVMLTCATVAFSGIDLGRGIVFTALIIAGIKAVLVLNIFMQLKYEERLFKIFVMVALVTFMIFIGLTFADYAFK